MEFLPHTREALNEYLSLADPDLEGSLLTMGASVERIVPDCVGLSLTLYDEDLTFTLVAPDLAGSDVPRLRPGVDGRLGRGGERRPPAEPAPSQLDEGRWADFARSSAAAGVASSLSLPVLDRDRVVGDINLYASSPEAFHGRHRDLAAALGASASGVVTNADLAFETRRRAEEAPRLLREQQAIEVGTGILAARAGLDVDTARVRLREASARAGVTDLQAALVLITVHRP